MAAFRDGPGPVCRSVATTALLALAAGVALPLGPVRAAAGPEAQPPPHRVWWAGGAEAARAVPAPPQPETEARVPVGVWGDGEPTGTRGGGCGADGSSSTPEGGAQHVTGP